MDTHQNGHSGIRRHFEKVFDEAYNKLNPMQRRAVDRIDGPVMVNAGPGTGKTQILAMRIGKILREQDVSPHNILCLTYTDSATLSMRQRLVEIIGPMAHKVHIYTFHGFCNQVIQENLDIFGGYKMLEPISDLETVDVYRDIIDQIPDDNILKRFKGDRYFEQKRLKNLFDLMKKEDLTVEDMHLALDRHLEEEKSDDRFYAKRKYTNKEGTVYQKGDFRDDNFAKYVAKFDPLRAAIDLFPQLAIHMEKMERYDYNDMILWVIEAFKTNGDLLAEYQERYLYFLVDEYQDTNGAQNHLLGQLISYWDKPNVFVVGDDDQAIYKFQGANLNNIMDFKQSYDPYTIVLEENYRSNQHILDAASALIGFNEERLVKKDPQLTKQLKASGRHRTDDTSPQIKMFPKVSHEYAYLVRELENLAENDPDTLKDTAVIYRKHRQVRDIVAVLEKKNIPLNIKRRVNVLELPLVINILNILRYLADEHKSYGRGHHRLFEILHYPYWNIRPVDIGRLALACQKRNEDGQPEDWRMYITDRERLANLNLRDPDAIYNAGQILEKWMKDRMELTLQSLFENIINEGGILRYLMQQADKAWSLQVVNTLFEFIKDETAHDPDMSLEELISMIDKMKENNIELSVHKIISSEKGVQFITAHSAKGMEFERVYMVGCTKDIWDDNSRSYNQYAYPSNINADSSGTEEDERRLFYVAMTRAETDLVISYSAQREDGKELGPSVFVDELKAAAQLEVQEPSISEEDVLNFYHRLLVREPMVIELIEHDLIDRWLESYQMSVTHLNKYLQCPLSFYFESILRIPHARNAASGFGSAVHDALWSFFTHYKKSGEQDASRLVAFFRDSMKKYRSHFTDDEYNSYLVHGERTMLALYEEKSDTWFVPKKIEVEARIDKAEYDGIPLKGFLDKVEIFDHHVHVIDYKTGNFNYSRHKLKPPSDKEPNGGDYWRQLVFYRILLDSDRKHRWNMQKGQIVYVEPDRTTGQFKTHEAAITPEDIDLVGQQIRDTWDRIRQHDFNRTCEEEDCVWCNFVKENYTFNSALLDAEHEPE